MLHSILSCTFILCALSVCFATITNKDGDGQMPVKPLMKVFHDMVGLRDPDWHEGKNARHSFHHVDEEKRSIHLEYDVEHHDDILFLQAEEHIVRVDCTDSTLKLYYDSYDAARVHSIDKHTLITGGREWGCLREGVESVIMRRSLNYATVQTRRGVGGSVIVLVDTEDAGYASFFKNAHVSFYATKFPEDHFSHHMHHEAGVPEYEEMYREEATQKRASWGSKVKGFLRDTWDKANELGGHVKKVITQVLPGVLKALLTGDYDDQFSASHEVAFNLDPITKNTSISNFEVGAGVQCTNCWLRLEAGVHFELRIQNYELLFVHTSISGEVELNIQGLIELESFADFDEAKTVATITSPPIVFVIAGVPVSVEIHMPIEVGAFIHATANCTIISTVNLLGSVQFGMTWDPMDGVQWINARELVHTGQIEEIALDIDAQAMVWLLPSIFLKVDYVGGPYVGFKPFIEFAALTSPIGDEIAKGCDIEVFGVASSLNWGIQISIGGRIDITVGKSRIFNKEWDPTVLWSVKNTISSGCLVFPDGLPLTTHNELRVARLGEFDILASAEADVGNVWTGAERRRSASFDKLAEKCAVYPVGAQFSLQLMDNSDPQSLFFAGSSYTEFSRGSCLSQNAYSGVESLNPSFDLALLVQQDDQDLNECDHSELSAPTSSKYATWLRYPDLLYIQSDDGCVSVIASRQRGSERLADDVDPDILQCFGFPLEFQAGELWRWTVSDAGVVMSPNSEWYITGQQSGQLRYLQYGSSAPPADALWTGKASATFDFQKKLDAFGDVSCASYVVVEVFQELDIGSEMWLTLNLQIGGGAYYESDLMTLNVGSNTLTFDLNASIWWIGPMKGLSIPQEVRSNIESVKLSVHWGQHVSFQGYGRTSFDHIRLSKDVGVAPVYACAIDDETQLVTDPCGGKVLGREALSGEQLTVKGESLVCEGTSNKWVPVEAWGNIGQILYVQNSKLEYACYLAPLFGLLRDKLPSTTTKGGLVPNIVQDLEPGVIVAIALAIVCVIIAGIVVLLLTLRYKRSGRRRALTEIQVRREHTNRSRNNSGIARKRTGSGRVGRRGTDLARGSHENSLRTSDYGTKFVY